MQRVLPLVTLLLLTALAPAIAPAQGSAVSGRHIVDGVAAEVNGEPVTVRDVMEKMEQSAAGLNIESLEDQDIQRLYAQALEECVRAQLVLQEYAASDMRIPDWVFEKRIAEIVESNFGGDRQKLVDELARMKKTYTEWREEIKDALVLTAMRMNFVDKGVIVGPAKILDYYRAHEAEFTRPAGTHLMLIQLKLREGETPEAFENRVATLRKRLDSEPFAKIARFFSVDASAPRGGDWGWIQPDSLRKELATALETLSVSETSDPIATPAGMYILRKEGVRESGLQPIDAVRDEIAATLRREESERLYREWTDSLRAKAQVRILRPTM